MQNVVVLLFLLLPNLSLCVLPEQSLAFSLLVVAYSPSDVLVDEFALLPGALGVLWGQENSSGFLGFVGLALPPVVVVVGRPPVARVADCVGGRCATTSFVQSGTAPGAYPAGLESVVRRVGARLALGAPGVPATTAVLHYAPTRGATAAVSVATVMTQVSPRQCHL